MNAVNGIVFDRVLDYSVHIVRNNASETVIRYSWVNSSDEIWAEIQEALYEFINNLERSNHTDGGDTDKHV